MATKTKKKRILITGANGFLGKAVVDLLTENENYEIVSTNRSIHDLTKLEDCLLATKNIDTIIHLAGLVRSRREQKRRPAETLSINLLTTLNIAEAAQQNRVKRIIFLSSVTAYPENIETPFREKELWNGPVADESYAYGTAKRLTETIARAYDEQYGIETTTLLLPNLYGPGDKFTHTPPPFVPNVILQIQQAIQERIPVISGGDNGDVELDLLYVGDAARAIGCALKAKTLPSLMNISTDTTITVGEVYTIVARLLEYDGIIEWEKGISAPPPRFMDATLAHTHLDWHNQTSFETGIKNTISSFFKK